MFSGTWQLRVVDVTYLGDGNTISPTFLKARGVPTRKTVQLKWAQNNPVHSNKNVTNQTEKKTTQNKNMIERGCPLVISWVMSVHYTSTLSTSTTIWEYLCKACRQKIIVTKNGIYAAKKEQTWLKTVHIDWKRYIVYKNYRCDWKRYTSGKKGTGNLSKGTHDDNLNWRKFRDYQITRRVSRCSELASCRSVKS